MPRNLAIVIPTYNERNNVGKLIFDVHRLLPEARIFVVDDNSPDGTAEVVRKLAAANERVRLIWRDSRQGLASAYLDAFARLIPDETVEFIITMDADLSHQPADILKLLEHAKTHEMVVGSRYIAEGHIQDWAKWRLLVSKYGNIYTKIVTGVPIEDLTAGFVLYHRNLLLKILAAVTPRQPYAYQTEIKYLAHRAGAKIKEVPIVFRERSSGKSKLKKNAILEALFFPWYLRFFR